MLLLRPIAGHSDDPIIPNLFQREDLFPTEVGAQELAEPRRGRGVGMFFVGEVNSREAPLGRKVEMVSLPSLVDLKDETPRLGLIDFLKNPTP